MFIYTDICTCFENKMVTNGLQIFTVQEMNITLYYIKISNKLFTLFWQNKQNKTHNKICISTKTWKGV